MTFFSDEPAWAVLKNGGTSLKNVAPSTITLEQQTKLYSMETKKVRLTILVLMLVSLLLLSTDVAAQCTRTPTMGMGTHFKEINVHKVDISTGLVIYGRVLSASDCSPIAGARIAHWQTNKEGIYIDQLRAYLFSGNDGQYRFETEWPGASVPHIHFIVTAEDYEKLVTMWIGTEQVEQITLDFVLQPEELPEG